MPFRHASSETWRTVIASALEQMDVACWEYDMTTRELWWSDNAGPLVGRPRGFTPSDFGEAEAIFLRDSDRPFHPEAVIANLEAGPVDVDRLAVLPGGTMRWTHHRYFLIVDDEGEPQRLAGMMTDIDRRRRLETEDSTLFEASKILSRSLDMGETLASIASLTVPKLADWCVVHLMEQGSLQSAVTVHADPTKVRLAEAIQQEFPVDMDSPFGAPAVVRSGKPELYRETSDEMLRAAAGDDERRLEILRQVGYRSVMVVPLSVRQQTIGTVTMVAADSSVRFDEQSLQFAERLATPMAVAIDNARLHGQLLEAWDRERGAVDTLQRGLSPDPLPDLAGIGLAAHYEIGGGDKVGGDWYDVFGTADGDVAFVIGDVVGRGVPAVASMSRYRNALKASLFRGDRPGRAATDVNRFGLVSSRQHEAFATTICMLYDPHSRVMVGTRAGHPPALVRSADGHVEWLGEDRSGPPFGVDADREYEEWETKIEPGSMLVLYTDGLIERRDESIDVSMDRLAAAMREAPDDPAEAVAHLLEQLPSYPTSDDVAILVATFHG